VAQHPEERLLDVEVEGIQVDAVGLDAAVDERAGTVVAPAGER
jgi:hypothetical protein